LFSASPIASYVCDGDGNIVECNAAAEALWGRKPQAGEKWSGATALYYPDGQTMPLEATPMARVVREQIYLQGGQELIIGRPDGSRRVVLAFPKPIRTAVGQLVGAHNTLVDITDYKQYEEKQTILSEIVQSSDDAIISKSLDGMIMS